MGVRYIPSNMTTIAGDVMLVRDKSVMIDLGSDGKRFIPKSVILDPESVDEGDNELVVQNWYLRKEGLL